VEDGGIGKRGKIEPVGNAGNPRLGRETTRELSGRNLNRDQLIQHVRREGRPSSSENGTGVVTVRHLEANFNLRKGGEVEGGRGTMMGLTGLGGNRRRNESCRLRDVNRTTEGQLEMEHESGGARRGGNAIHEDTWVLTVNGDWNNLTGELLVDDEVGDLSTETKTGLVMLHSRTRRGNLLVVVSLGEGSTGIVREGYTAGSAFLSTRGNDLNTDDLNIGKLRDEGLNTRQLIQIATKEGLRGNRSGSSARTSSGVGGQRQHEIDRTRIIVKGGDDGNMTGGGDWEGGNDLKGGGRRIGLGHNEERMEREEEREKKVQN
jgi:hypothetical protein